MKQRSCLIVLVMALGLACAEPARAHFVWLLPHEVIDKIPAVHMIFSEDTQPDRPELLEKIAQTELFARGPDGKTTRVKAVLGKDAWRATMPSKGLQEVAGLCCYGVVRHGKSEPFLLHYYAKTFVGFDFKKPSHRAALGRAWDKLPLEIVPVWSGKGGPALRVLWSGKPLAGAPVAVLVPGREKKVEGETDRNGLFPLTAPKGNGCYGVRVLYKEAKEGEREGKSYKEVRYYATLTFEIPIVFEGVPYSESPASTKNSKAVADTEATKLLADARAARALYHHFPGFTADIEVNLDGKATRGQVEVRGKGKVSLKLDSADADKWAKNTLASIIAHRLDSGASDGETPCAFVDDDTRHPLGRAIRVLNDEFHSSYRIRDRQVLVVNRHMPGSRFTIIVMENVVTNEKKFLPACYVVNTWDAKTDALTSSETHHQTWQRVGAFDLPRDTLAVKATAGKLESRGMKLSNVHLHK
jgi:uncharacterized GH25 family protein